MCTWTTVIKPYIICCRVKVTLDIILGIEDILISWFILFLAPLGVALLFVCCMIHCNLVSICFSHITWSCANKPNYLLTYLVEHWIKRMYMYLRRRRVGGVNAPVGSLDPVCNFLCC